MILQEFGVTTVKTESLLNFKPFAHYTGDGSSKRLEVNGRVKDCAGEILTVQATDIDLDRIHLFQCVDGHDPRSISFLHDQMLPPQTRAYLGLELCGDKKGSFYTATKEPKEMTVAELKQLAEKHLDREIVVKD